MKKEESISNREVLFDIDFFAHIHQYVNDSFKQNRFNKICCLWKFNKKINISMAIFGVQHYNVIIPNIRIVPNLSHSYI